MSRFAILQTPYSLIIVRAEALFPVNWRISVPYITLHTWDRSSWSALGTGVGGGGIKNVYALVICDNNLVVGGAFNVAGGVSTIWSAEGSRAASMSTELWPGSMLLAGRCFC